MANLVQQLVATEHALDKLAARGISADEPPQLRHNRYVVVHNPRDPERRRFLIGSTDGGRVLTLVIGGDGGSDDLADRDRLGRNRGRT